MNEPIYPVQCQCGHLYLEKYTFKEPQNRVHGFCWCGFCRTRLDVKAIEPILRCPYCGKPLPDNQTPCCGEVGHGTTEEEDE